MLAFEEYPVRAAFRAVAAFLVKFGNDWGMSLATLLAFNFLTAIFPLFLGILALGAFVLPNDQSRQLAAALTSALPTEVTSKDGLNLNFYSMLTDFHLASKVTAVVSFTGFIWTGSNLFSAMENCFSIIFRTRGRDPIRQKLMAIGMVFLFAALAPLAVVAATVSSVFPMLAAALGHVPGQATLLTLAGYVISACVAFALFFLIYEVVPNRRMHPAEVWRGALIAALVFVAVNAAFPVYVARFMTHAWFGRILLVFGVLAFWFWVISLVVVLGAELNSFLALGQRALPADVAGLLQIEALRNQTETPPMATPPVAPPTEATPVVRSRRPAGDGNGVVAAPAPDPMPVGSDAPPAESQPEPSLRRTSPPG